MRQKGSITVFSALAFMLVASFLFALLEAGRRHHLETYADMCSSLAVESVCAEYQPQLWKEYRLLGLDGAYGGETFSMEQVMGVLGARLRANLTPEGAGGRLMQLELEALQPDGYQLITDGDGHVFLHCVASYMSANLPVEVAGFLYSKYAQNASVEENAPETENVEQAQAMLEEAWQQAVANRQQAVDEQEQTDADLVQESGQGIAHVEENPLEVVLAAKQNALLGMVVEDVGSLSTSAIRSEEMIERRIIERGTLGVPDEGGWYEKILSLEYLEKYFGDYRKPAQGHALAYEQEYILFGQERDRDNLERVIERLLLIREAANVSHIVADSEKYSASMTLANAIAGFTGNPAIIKVVQLGIVAAWAYVESILDLRALLAGDKIALLKSRDQWTSQLGSLTQAFTENMKAKACEDGVDYQGYLKGFLLMMTERDFAFRMMGIMEQNIRQIPLYHSFRMDHILSSISCEISYVAQPLFWNLSVLGSRQLAGMMFQTQKSFSYY